MKKSRRRKKKLAKPKTLFRYYHISPTPNLKKLVPYSHRHGKATDRWMDRWESDKKKELSREARLFVREHTRRIWFYSSILEAWTCSAEFAENLLYIYRHDTEKRLAHFEGRAVSRKPVLVQMIGEIEKFPIGNTGVFDAALRCYEGQIGAEDIEKARADIDNAVNAADQYGQAGAYALMTELERVFSHSER